MKHSNSTDLAATTGKTFRPETVKFCRNTWKCSKEKALHIYRKQDKGLSIAKEHLNKNIAFWEIVLFTDESKFNVFGCNGHSMIWRKANKAMRFENLVPTIKHGGGNVIVWNAMAAPGLVGKLVFSEGIMDQYKVYGYSVR